MSHMVPDVLLSQLSEFVSARLGLHFPRERWHDLERAVESAARELEFPDAEACLHWFLTTPASKTQVEILASHLTVGETYFFREAKSFEVAENQVLKDLIRSRRGNDQRLRIWSAGCATGEEPYSVAMLLDRLLPDRDDWNVAILATDINPRFLQKASAGLYAEWSFRGVPGSVKEKYFRASRTGGWQILDRIKRMVTFSYLNLAEDAYPALTNGTNAMDLVFCRNVLMYFSQPCAKRVIQNLHHCLVENGWLIVSPVETSHALFNPFVPVSFSGVTLYRKTAERVQAVSAFELRPEATGAEPEIVTFKPPSVASEPATPAFEENIPSATGPVEPRAVAKAEPAPYDEALTLYQQGRYDEAADKISKILSEQPDDTQAMDLLARALANRGKLADARVWCEKAVAADKLNAAYHYLLATIQQECGQVSDSVASLKRALYLDHNFALAHFALGNLARLQGKANESAKHYANALSVLNACRPEDVLPESEGMTARRLVEIIQAMTYRKAVA